MSRESDLRVARAGELARAHYASGANCAESVLLAIPDALDDESLRLPQAIGMGWTAGIGEGGCLCGALAAGIMVVGAQSDALPGAIGAKRQRSLDSADEVRSAFKEQFGSTCCRVLRRGMEPGTAECRAHCEELTSRTAEMVAAQLTERTDSPVPFAGRFAPRDMLGAGLRALAVTAIALGGFGAAAILLNATARAGVIAGFASVTFAVSLVWALIRAGRG